MCGENRRKIKWCKESIFTMFPGNVEFVIEATLVAEATVPVSISENSIMRVLVYFLSSVINIGSNRANSCFRSCIADGKIPLHVGNSFIHRILNYSAKSTDEQILYISWRCPKYRIPCLNPLVVKQGAS